MDFFFLSLLLIFTYVLYDKMYNNTILLLNNYSGRPFASLRVRCAVFEHAYLATLLIDHARKKHAQIT